jgi:hypothetical protein
MIRLVSVLSLSVIVAGLAASDGHAATPKELGSYNDWTAYMLDDRGAKVCYVASQPKKAEGNYSSRGDIFALVTHRPQAKTVNVVSIIAGYPYRDGGEVSLVVDDSKTFRLFTQGETAWAKDAETDKALVAAMRAGSRMVVKGTSSRGTLTTDTYSLAGFGRAHDRATRECGVKL